MIIFLEGDGKPEGDKCEAVNVGIGALVCLPDLVCAFNGLDTPSTCELKSKLYTQLCTKQKSIKSCL